MSSKLESTDDDNDDTKDVLSAEDLIELAQVQSSSAAPTSSSPTTVSADHDTAAAAATAKPPPPPNNDKTDSVLVVGPPSSSLHRGQRFVPHGAFSGGGGGTVVETVDMAAASTTSSTTIPIEAILVGPDDSDDYGNPIVDDDDDDDSIYTAEPLSVWTRKGGVVWSPQKWAYCGLAALCLLSVIAVATAVVVVTQRRRPPSLRPPREELLEKKNTSYTYHTALFGSVVADETTTTTTTDACTILHHDRRLHFKIRCGVPQALMHLHADETLLDDLSAQVVAGSEQEDELIVSIPPDTVASIAFDCQQDMSTDYDAGDLATVLLAEQYDIQQDDTSLPSSSSSSLCSMTAFVHVRTRPTTTCADNDTHEEQCSGDSQPLQITMDPESRGTPFLWVCQQTTMHDSDEACSDAVSSSSYCLPRFGVTSTRDCPAQPFQEPLLFADNFILGRQAEVVERHMRARVNNNNNSTTTTMTSPEGG